MLEENFYYYGKRRVRYFKIGSGKPILFLHGGGVSALAYKKILKLLSKKYLVIAPDLPGFGKSSAAKSSLEYVRILEKFLSSLDMKNYAIVGHSFGGLEALRISADKNNNSFLIIADSAGVSLKISRFRFLYILLVEKTIRSVYIYKNLTTMLRIAGFFLSNIFFRIKEIPSLFHIMKRFLYTDFNDSGKINSRTLILWGRDDEIFPIENAEIFHKKIINSEVKYVNANHDWVLFNPEKFSKIVTDWLKQNGY